MWRVLSIACAVWLVAGAARAADEGDPRVWAPPDTELALVFHGADTVADALDALAQRFGGTPTVDRAIERLRGWTLHGMRPAAREWGEGLAPGRGVAVFGAPGKRARVVVGATDAAAAKQRLAELARLANLDVEVTAEGLREGDDLLRCGQRGGFLVCDNQEAPPEQAPGAPAWLAAGPARPWLLFAASGSFAQEIGEGAPVEAVRVLVDRGADRVTIMAEGRLPAAAAALLAPFRTDAGAAAGLGTVDARTPGLFKLAFDGPRLLAAAEQQMGTPPPAVAPLWAALKAAWSGDVVFSFAGGLAHPVVAVGMRDEKAGRALVDAVIAFLQGSGVPVQHDPAGEALVEIVPAADAPDGEAIRLRLRYAFTADSLVLALAAPDLARIREGRLQALALPPGFADRGTHGFLIQDLPTFLYGGILPDVVVGGPTVNTVTDAQTMLALYAMLVEEFGATMRVDDGSVRVDLWWSLL